MVSSNPNGVGKKERRKIRDGERGEGKETNKFSNKYLHNVTSLPQRQLQHSFCKLSSVGFGLISADIVDSLNPLWMTLKAIWEGRERSYTIKTALTNSSQTVSLGTLGLHRYSVGKIGGIRASHSLSNQSTFSLIFFLSWGSVEEILLAKTVLRAVTWKAGFGH